MTIQKVVNLTFADEGIEVFAVSDGIEAVDRLMEISPDLVMADVNMPGINGYLVCERIKQHEKFRNTPVILLVGSFEPFDEDEARRVGADDYLTKPFQSIRQLVSKVSDLLESNGNAEMSASVAATGSFAETQEMPLPVVEAEIVEEDETPRYDARAGYDDDEMIQTNPATSFAFDEVQKFSATSGNYIEDREEDYGKTQQLSSADWQEMDVAPENRVSSYQEDDQISSTEDSAPQPQQQTSSRSIESVDDDGDDDDFLELFDDEEFDDEEDETENVRTQAEIAGSASEITAKSQTSFSENESYRAAEAGSSHEQAEYIQSVETENNQTFESSETFNSSEAQSFQTAETENVYSSQSESAQTGEIENGQAASGNESFQISENTASAPTGDAYSQFSPELIDAIAQRVIEKLSDRAVKEIAWEVVPQQADLIIKKMVEEKLKE